MGGAYILRFGGSGGGVISLPTLAIVDNGDGTGATATITNSDVGVSNTVYVARIRGDIGTLSWTSAGTRTGDGTVDLSLAKGLYFGRCDSEAGGKAASSNLVFFTVTEEGDSVHAEILLAAGARAALLSLDGLTGGVLVRYEPPLTPPSIYPYIAFTIEGESEQVLESNNAVDTVAYPVRVLFFDERAMDTDAKREQRLKWREQIRRAFINQRLSGVDEVFSCRVEPLQIADLQTLEVYDKLVGGMTLRFVVRETRGLT